MSHSDYVSLLCEPANLYSRMKLTEDRKSSAPSATCSSPFNRIPLVPIKALSTQTTVPSLTQSKRIQFTSIIMRGSNQFVNSSQQQQSATINNNRITNNCSLLRNTSEHRSFKYRYQNVNANLISKFIIMIILIVLLYTFNSDFILPSLVMATNSNNILHPNHAQPYQSYDSSRSNEQQPPIIYQYDNDNQNDNQNDNNNSNNNNKYLKKTGHCIECSLSPSDTIDIGSTITNQGNFHHHFTAQHQYSTRVTPHKINPHTLIQVPTFNPSTAKHRSYSNHSNSLSFIFDASYRHRYNHASQQPVVLSNDRRHYFNYHHRIKTSGSSNNQNSYNYHYDDLDRVPETILIIGPPIKPPPSTLQANRIFKLDQNQDCPQTGRTVCDQVHFYPIEEIYRVVSTVKISLSDIGFQLDNFFLDERENDPEPFLGNPRDITLENRLGSGILVYETQVNYPAKSEPPPPVNYEQKVNSSTKYQGQQNHYEYVPKINADNQQYEKEDYATKTSGDKRESLFSASSEARMQSKNGSSNIDMNTNENKGRVDLAIIHNTKKTRNQTSNGRLGSLQNKSLFRRPRQSDPESDLNQVQISPLCAVRSRYITPRAALSDKREWKYVVNTPEKDPRVRQIIKVDICEDPSGPCSDQVSLPFGFVSQCKQKYSKKKLLAFNGDNRELEVDTFFIPSCCVCQVIRDTSISDDLSKKSSR